MGGRNSDIRKANRLAAALTNLRAHEDQIRDPKLNSRGARSPSIDVYITPYGRSLLATEIAVVRSQATGYTALTPFINGTGVQSAVINAPGSKEPVRIPNFRPARIVWFRNATRVVTPATSDATKQKYLKYEGTRATCAFGKKVAADTLYEGFELVKTAITAVETFKVNRVTLMPEVNRYN